MNDKLAEGAGISKPSELSRPPPIWRSLSPDPRRPVPPTPVEPFELVHPAIPPGAEGVTLLHVADLHIRKGRPRTPAMVRAAEALAATPVDLVVLTGDYMNYPGDEQATLEALKFIAVSCRARHGVWGIFGNHDSWELCREAKKIPGVEWLTSDRPEIDPIPGVPLSLVGCDEPEDLFALSLRAQQAGRPLRERFCIALAHYPTEVYTASTLGIPIVLAGHTHGGQFRLAPRCAPHTSCDLPAHLATGLLRYGDTLCAVSRGVGQAIVEMRINCPPQLPLYRLRRGPLDRIKAGLSAHRTW